MAIISILGLYKWDDTILTPLVNAVPSSIDGIALQGELLAQCAELEIIYPDAEVFKEILGYWCVGQSTVWNRLSKALEAEYNITENYDRTETWTDTENGSTGRTGSNADQYKAYPSTSDLVEQHKTTVSSKDTIANTNTHTGRVHGNIGVRSAQELVEQELELAYKTNLQQIIIDDFKKRFCILVY